MLHTIPIYEHNSGDSDSSARFVLFDCFEVDFVTKEEVSQFA
jgi:hypothetical protein